MKTKKLLVLLTSISLILMMLFSCVSTAPETTTKPATTPAPVTGTVTATPKPTAEKLTVLNPSAPIPEIDLKAPSPRLSDLNNKVVYIYSTRIKNPQEYPLWKTVVREMTAKFPKVKVVIYERKVAWTVEDTSAYNEIATKANAFIWGIHSSGSETYRDTERCIAIEKRGIPGVHILDVPFKEEVIQGSLMAGMPAMRYLTFPIGGVIAATASPHERADSLTDKDLVDYSKQIIDALTMPLTDKEKTSGTFRPLEPSRIAVTGTLDEVQKYFIEHHLTDGLPIIPPTEERVAQMLKGTKHAPNEVVALMYPLKLEATVEKVAMVGVMAGCKPDYMPVLLAIVEAFNRGVVNGGTVRSSNSFVFASLVSGPIRKEIGMNMDIWSLGPSNQANASIGRFLRLAIYCLGGGRTGVNLQGTQGNPAGYSFCIPENEESSPWEPWHVQHGYKPTDSVVTVFRGGWCHAGNSPDLDDIARYIANFEQPEGVVVMPSPLAADGFVKKGLKTKQDVIDYLWSHATATMGEIKARPYWESVPSNVVKWITEGKDLYAGYSNKDWWPKENLALPDSAVVACYPHSQVHVVVVGGENNPWVTSWKLSFPQTASIDKWR